MTPEEQALEEEYFPMMVFTGTLSMFHFKNDEDTYSSFAVCESCWATVHVDHTVRHARWHEKIKEAFGELAKVMKSHTHEL